MLLVAQIAILSLFTLNVAYAGVHEQSTTTCKSKELCEKVKNRGALIEPLCLRLGGVIGAGCFGKVRKGVLYAEPNCDKDKACQFVAIKTIKGWYWIFDRYIVPFNCFCISYNAMLWFELG